MEELSLQMSLQAGSRYTVGYTESRGRGCLTVIGLSPSPELLLALYDYLNVRLPSRSLTPQISTALFRREQDFYLLAVNDGNEDKIADVIVHGEILEVSPGKARNLISSQEWTVNLQESNHLIFPLPRKDGIILQLQGA
jgi:hypothetical protein